MSVESVMPSYHLILCHPLLLLHSIFPSIKVFSNESTLHIRWPKYWSFSFSISPSNEYSRVISFRIDWLDLFAVQKILKSLLQLHSSKAELYLRLWQEQFLGSSPAGIHNIWFLVLVGDVSSLVTIRRRHSHIVWLSMALFASFPSPSYCSSFNNLEKSQEMLYIYIFFFFPLLDIGGGEERKLTL